MSCVANLWLSNQVIRILFIFSLLLHAAIYLGPFATTGYDERIPFSFWIWCFFLGTLILSEVVLACFFRLSRLMKQKVALNLKVTVLGQCVPFLFLCGLGWLDDLTRWLKIIFLFSKLLQVFVYVYVYCVVERYECWERELRVDGCHCLWKSACGAIGEPASTSWLLTQTPSSVQQQIAVVVKVHAIEEWLWETLFGLERLDSAVTEYEMCQWLNDRWVSLNYSATQMNLHRALYVLSTSIVFDDDGEKGVQFWRSEEEEGEQEFLDGGKKGTIFHYTIPRPFLNSNVEFLHSLHLRRSVPCTELLVEWLSSPQVVEEKERVLD